MIPEQDESTQAYTQASFCQLPEPEDAETDKQGSSIIAYILYANALQETTSLE
jgi:hypothetical protein